MSEETMNSYFEAKDNDHEGFIVKIMDHELKMADKFIEVKRMENKHSIKIVKHINLRINMINEY